MTKRYYVFLDRDWKACGTIDIDAQTSDVEVVIHLKAMSYLDTGLAAEEIRVLHPKVGDVLLLQYRGNPLLELCAA